MTILSSLLGVRAQSLESPTLPLTSSALIDWLGGPRAHSGRRVTERNAFGMPAVWRAISLIAGTSASLQLCAFKDGEDGARVLQRSGQGAQLLADPHPDMTPFEVWELGYVTALAWGNVSYRKVRDGLGAVKELWWIDPNRIKYGRSSDGTKVYELDGDQERTWTDREILHVPGLGYDGVCGISPIQAAREGIGLALAAEEYGARLFGQGSLATGILTTEQRLDQGQADAMKERWKAGGGIGLDSAHDIRVLGSGAKFQQLTIPPEDAQFIESRRFQIGEIARIFGIPPHMLGETERSTSWGTGIEQQALGFVTFTLRPWLTRFERRISKHLLNPGPVYAKYQLDELMRGDSAARAAFYRQMWELGAFSTNDILAAEQRQPVEGGERRWRPLNFAPLDEVDVTVPGPVHAPETAPAGGSGEGSGGGEEGGSDE